MPRYFFNVYAETFAQPDLVGRELPDDASARSAGQEVAKDVAIYELSGSPFPGRPWIEILDEDQRPVALVPAHELPAEPNRSS